MSASDGIVHGVTKIFGDQGPRWNLVLLSEGYRVGELTTFATDADKFVQRLIATAPFRELAPAINVFRIDVSSTDCGADDPVVQDGGTGATAATFFDASFGGYGIRRLLLLDTVLARNVSNGLVPDVRASVVIVNSTIYGGSGDWVAAFSRAPEAELIALHELGHTAFNLADEYDYFSVCDERDRREHPGPEPAAANVTRFDSGEPVKWHSLITPGTMIPTMTNPNCARCDTQPATVLDDTVGLFEGADRYHCKIYRPTFDCRMRTLETEFCAVCKDHIRTTLRPFLP